jgi:N-methylhydantoinase B
MTNTLNTPVEALEYAYPMQVTKYAIRDRSGGTGKFLGGNGVIRDIKLLTSATISLLTDRRKTQPYGLSGGSPGLSGENRLIHEGVEQQLSGKGTFEVSSGSIISIRTPGGGGYGRESA